MNRERSSELPTPYYATVSSKEKPDEIIAITAYSPKGEVKQFAHISNYECDLSKEEDREMLAGVVATLTAALNIDSAMGPGIDSSATEHAEEHEIVTFRRPDRTGWYIDSEALDLYQKGAGAILYQKWGSADHQAIQTREGKEHVPY